MGGVGTFSGESLIAEIRRNARYQADDYAALQMEKPIDAGLIARRMRMALEEAETFVRRMPSDKEGLLFLKNGKPVQPDPENLSCYTEHAGQRRGIWPSSFFHYLPCYVLAHHPMCQELRHEMLIWGEKMLQVL